MTLSLASRGCYRNTWRRFCLILLSFIIQIAEAYMIDIYLETLIPSNFSCGPVDRLLMNLEFTLLVSYPTITSAL
jgi:hypothetical protein